MSKVGNYIVKLPKNIGHDNMNVSNTFIIHCWRFCYHSAHLNSGQYAHQKESTVLIPWDENSIGSKEHPIFAIFYNKLNLHHLLPSQQERLTCKFNLQNLKHSYFEVWGWEIKSTSARSKANHWLDKHWFFFINAQLLKIATKVIQSRSRSRFNEDHNLIPFLLKLSLSNLSCLPKWVHGDERYILKL